MQTEGDIHDIHVDRTQHTPPPMTGIGSRPDKEVARFPLAPLGAIRRFHPAKRPPHGNIRPGGSNIPPKGCRSCYSNMFLTGFVDLGAGLPNTQPAPGAPGHAGRYSRPPIDRRAAPRHSTPMPTPLTTVQPESCPPQRSARQHGRGLMRRRWWYVAMQLLMKEGRGRGAGGL